MNPRATFPKIEVVGELVRLGNGKLVLRARNGRAVELTAFARTTKQADGSFVIEPLSKTVGMADAVKISGIPYSTLLRVIELGRVVAGKPSVGRWQVNLESLLAHKARASTEPDYWNN